MHVVFIIKVLTIPMLYIFTLHHCLSEGNVGGRGGYVQSTSSSSSASAFIQTPVNTTVCLGSTAQFVCSATDVISIFYNVDYMPFSAVVSRGISVSAPTYSGNMIRMDLTVTGAVVNHNSLITCVAVVSNGTAMTSSAYLSIQGQSNSIWYVLIQYVD